MVRSGWCQGCARFDGLSYTHRIVHSSGRTECRSAYTAAFQKIGLCVLIQAENHAPCGLTSLRAGRRDAIRMDAAALLILQVLLRVLALFSIRFRTRSSFERTSRR